MGVIEVEGLSIQFSGGKKSVKECTFAVEEGEVFGLLGSNGAGKSTLLKAFAGIIKDYRGRLTILGQNCRFNHDVFNNLAYVPQSPCMLSDFTVRENLDFFCSMEGVPCGKKAKRMEELLSEFCLGDFVNMQAGRLSGGYRQLLNIALSSILDKQMILMDEPTAGLDLWSKRMVTEHIKSLKEAGKTVILTTHDLGDAQELCDRIVFIRDGRMLASGETRQLLREMGGNYTIKITFKKPIKAKDMKFMYSRLVVMASDHLVVLADADKVGSAIKELVIRLDMVSDIGIAELDVREPSLSSVFSSIVQKVKE